MTKLEASIYDTNTYFVSSFGGPTFEISKSPSALKAPSANDSRIELRLSMGLKRVSFVSDKGGEEVRPVAVVVLRVRQYILLRYQTCRYRGTCCKPS